MFSSRLRQRECWPRLKKVLAAEKNLALKEVNTNDYDISLNAVKFTILDDLERELQTLHRYSNLLSAEPHLIIYFDEYDGSVWSDHVLILQEKLLDEHISIPVLPAQSVEDITKILRIYLDDEIPRVPAQVHDASAKVVLAQATAAVPHRTLSPKDIETVLRLFGSISGLERATRDDADKRKLIEQFGQRRAQEMIEFWQEEWMI